MVPVLAGTNATVPAEASKVPLLTRAAPLEVKVRVVLAATGQVSPLSISREVNLMSLAISMVVGEPGLSSEILTIPKSCLVTLSSWILVLPP